MSKKLVHDVALIATKLHEAGLTFEDAELAAQYCLVNKLTLLPPHRRRLAKSPSNTLWQGFPWGLTPEGHEYWYKRADLLHGVSYEH